MSGSRQREGEASRRWDK